MSRVAHRSRQARATRAAVNCVGLWLPRVREQIAGIAAPATALFLVTVGLPSAGMYYREHSGGLAYHLTDTWRVSVEILNVLDRRDHDIDYAYESRITATAPAVFEDVFHPVEPIQVRAALMARF
jgi:hypothetical protein